MHQVAAQSAVFCVICSLLMFVSDASGDQYVGGDLWTWLMAVPAMSSRPRTSDLRMPSRHPATVPNETIRTLKSQ